MSVLRIYRPDECSADGIPLDWNRCRGLDELDGGMGSLHEAMRQRGEDCPSCGGHESLKAAVLAELIGTRRYRVYDSYHGEFMDISEPVENPIARCSSCSHKMSEGTWEDPSAAGSLSTVETRARGERLIMRGEEPRAIDAPGTTASLHYSACDLLCKHGGPDGETAGRWAEWHPESVFASWRPVDIRVGMVAKRTLGDRFDPGNVLQVRPFDLTRENVSVMCLRCWAAPT